MQYYNIVELDNIVTNISSVTPDMGRLIFSFIRGDYEKENHKYLCMQAKNKRMCRIHKEITNRIRNLIKYEDYSNGCKICTKQIILGNWKYKDIPVEGHDIHVHRTFQDRDEYGVKQHEFADEVYTCLRSHNAVIRIKKRNVLCEDNYAIFTFKYNIGSIRILNEIYNSDSDWKGYDVRWKRKHDDDRCYRCYKLNSAYYNFKNELPTSWDWVREN